MAASRPSSPSVAIESKTSEVSPAESLTDLFGSTIDHLQTKFASFLLAGMEKEVYKKYFTEAKCTEDGAYEMVEEEKAEKVIVKYKQLLNLFVFLQKALVSADQVGVQATQLRQKVGWLGKARYAFKHRKALNQTADSALDAKTQVADTAKEIGLADILKILNQLLDPTQPKKQRLFFLLDLIGFEYQEIEKQILTNPFYVLLEAAHDKESKENKENLAHDQQLPAQITVTSTEDDSAEESKDSSLDEIKQEDTAASKSEEVSFSLTATMAVFKQLFQEDLPENLPQNRQYNKLKNESIKQMAELYQQIEELIGKSPSVLDVIWFFYQNAKPIIHIITNLQELYHMMRFEVRNKLLMTLRQLNLIFIEVMCWVDKAETTLLLKQGYLAEALGFKKILQDFYQEVAKLDYQFLLTEQYPFATKLQEKRNASQADSKETLALIQLRIQHSAAEQKKYQAAEAKQKNKDIKAQVIAKIDERIAELSKKKASFFSCSSAARELACLPDLKQTVLQADEGNLPIEVQPNSPLSKGEAAYLLKGIQDSQNRLTGSLAMLENQITQLDARRRNKFIFFASYRRAQYHLRIQGLKFLRQALLQPGYRIQNALDDLGAFHPDQFKAISRYEATLLKEIKKIDSNIVNAAIGKKIVAPLDASPAEEKENRDHIQQIINQRIAELRAEKAKLYLPFFSVKGKKIEILEKFRVLCEQSNFVAAIDQLATHPNFYLLWEGRTGERLRQLERERLQPPPVPVAVVGA